MPPRHNAEDTAQDAAGAPPALGASLDPSKAPTAAPAPAQAAARVPAVSFAMWFGSLKLPAHHADAMRAHEPTDGLLPPALWARRFADFIGR